MFSRNKNHPDGRAYHCKGCHAVYLKKRYRSSKKARDTEKRYYKKNKKRLNEQNKKWRAANQDKIREYEKTPQRKAYKYLCKSLKKLIKNSSNCHSIVVGCTGKELAIHIESQFQKGMTWENMGEWHIDHIKPCSWFDLMDIEQRRECFHYTNLQPLWAKDNLKKGSSVGVV